MVDLCQLHKRWVTPSNQSRKGTQKLPTQPLLLVAQMLENASLQSRTKQAYWNLSLRFTNTMHRISSFFKHTFFRLCLTLKKNSIHFAYGRRERTTKIHFWTAWSVLWIGNWARLIADVHLKSSRSFSWTAVAHFCKCFVRRRDRDSPTWTSSV